MKRISVLGAAVLLVAGLYAAAPTVAIAGPVVAGTDEQVCPEEGKVEVGEGQKSVVATAPEGMVIVGYCVSAGSAQQGDGPENVVVDPPATEVTITHSSGKDISHYTLFLEPAPEPEPEPGPADGQAPSPSELPRTGPAEAIGYTLLALAMIGGGGAFIVLARRRLG